MKIRYQTEAGELVSRAASISRQAQERAVKLAITKGAQSLERIDERGRKMNLTHILQNRISTL